MLKDLGSLLTKFVTSKTNLFDYCLKCQTLYYKKNPCKCSRIQEAEKERAEINIENEKLKKENSELKEENKKVKNLEA